MKSFTQQHYEEPVLTIAFVSVFILAILSVIYIVISQFRSKDDQREDYRELKR